MNCHARVVGVLLMGILLSQSTAISADDTELEGIQQVPIDLSSGVLQTVLPFDTPFMLSGSLPAGVVRIDGVWCDVTEKGKSAKKGKKTQKRKKSDIASSVNESGPMKKCSVVQPDRSMDPSQLTGWRGDPVTDGTTRKFYLFVPQRLEADHSFVFQFTLERQLSSTDLQAFQEKAEATLDREFRKVPPGTLTVSDWKPVAIGIQKILSSIPQRPGEEMVGSAGGLFGPEDQFPANPPWIREFQAAFDTQLNRDNVLDDTNIKGAAELFHGLTELQTDPALQALNAAVDAFNAEETSQLGAVLTSDVMAALETLSQVDDIGSPAIGNIAMAVQPLAAGQPASGQDLASMTISEQWHSVDIDPFLTNATSTVATLERLQRFASVAPQLAPLQQAFANLEAGSAALLEARIQNTRQAAVGVEANLRRLKSLLDERQQALQRLAKYVRRTAESQVTLVASSRGGFTTRAKNHISLDLGILYAGRIGEALPYAGANFYTRPVNRDVPLEEVGGFRRRFSLMMGVTSSSIEEMSDGGRVLRDDLIGSSALLIGAGYRLSDAARISAGVLVFEENDPNPLIDDLKISQEAFVAISFDVALKNLLGSLGTALGGG